ncbi:transmembrane 220 family protein [Pontibacter mangrovi]|uniref:Transmembrane family 220, helix n=1 Tax=Pontibacter mangrovi TaxID=2589816 RepID=A0A501W088_9BACT|nr:transmembrane 220 family protein [Pontibacter mangrovi]TPE43079.1 hypothetical protein FJM65_15680 [Pontibacter mangrovi]
MLLKKISANAFGLVFLSFVVVQYNDPDPLVWILIYSFAAVLCLLTAAGKVAPNMLWSAAMLYAVGGIYMWPEHFEGVSIGGGDIKNIEEARESLGLFLCALVFAGFALYERFALYRTMREQALQRAKWASGLKSH